MAILYSFFFYIMAEEISSITKVGSQCLCELDHPNKAIRCI
jgi:hypothetical protein